MNGYNAYRYESDNLLPGGTRWEYEDVIRENAARVDLMQTHYGASGLPLMSDGRVAYVNNSDAHGLIIGATGSKKTRLFAMPMMQMFARAGESVICTDPKGELFEKTSGLYAREGYHIQVLNLRDPLRSNGWNPLLEAAKLWRSGEKERSSALINDLAASIYPDRQGTQLDPFWTHSARAMFQGLCHLMIESGRLFSDGQISMASLPVLADGLTGSDLDGCTGKTNRLLNRLPKDALAWSNLRAVTTCSEKTFQNIQVSYNAPLQTLYAQTSLIRMLSVPDIEFETLGMRKSILYLIMPDEKTTLHMLISLVIKQCYEALIAAAQRLPGMKLPVRVNFLLDEFCNLPAIPDMSAMISAARSRNIRFYLVVQSMHQLVSKYGDDAYTIRGNCGDWVFLTSRELALLQELEALCGVNARTGQPLISVSQLQRLNKEQGEALVLSGRLYPYIAHLADIDRYPFAQLPPEALPELGEGNAPVTDLDEVLYNEEQRIRRKRRMKAMAERQEREKKNREAEAAKDEGKSDVEVRFKELFDLFERASLDAEASIDALSVDEDDGEEDEDAGGA